MHNPQTEGYRNGDAVSRPADTADAQLLEIETLVRRLRSDLDTVTRGLPETKAERIAELTELLSTVALHAARTAATAAGVLQNQRNSPRLFELDSLTELPNRALFSDRFDQALAHARRRGTRIGLLFIDLDEFKSINDRYGHTIGDDVIRLAARRLAAAVRDGDTVSRYGGDEFLVLLSDVSDAADAATLAGVVRRALSGTLRVGDDEIEIRASIGVSVFPEDGDDQDTLVQRADEAMFSVKRRRKTGEDTPVASMAIREVPASDAASDAPVFSELALREAEHRIQALRASNDDLLLSALVSANLQQRAERAAAEQAELLSVSSHELRGSLSALQSAAQTIVLTKGDPAHLPRLTLVLQRQIANMSRIIGDLLDVARLNSGRLALDYTPIDAVGMVADMVEQWQRYPQRTVVELDASTGRDGALIQADVVRLRQVLVSVLTLLSKRSPAPLRIRVSVGRVDRHCRIVLLASGALRPAAESVAEAVQSPPAVGQPHGAARTTAKLSLVLLRQLLEAHDGTLRFDRDPSTGGLRCVLELPVKHAATSLTNARQEM